jgi:hypothetical protein
VCEYILARSSARETQLDVVVRVVEFGREFCIKCMCDVLIPLIGSRFGRDCPAPVV